MLDLRDESLSIEEKEDLLRSVANRWGLPTKVKATHFILDPSEIVDWIDLYFLLGEMFVEEDRFFALGLDSLEDSLFELGIHNNLNVSLAVLDLPQLNAKLGEQYISSVISLFENAGIEVTISN